MRLRIIDRLDEHQIKDLKRLFDAEWWTQGRELHEIRTALEHSNEIFAWVEPDDNRIVAFARVLTDRVFKAMILDVIVAPSHRSTGLGRVVVQTVLDCERLAAVRHFELHCLEDLVPFYRRFGFVGDDTRLHLMRLKRERPA